MKEKLMTKVILNKEEHRLKLKKDRKLLISRNNNKSKFKDGVLNLSKNFMKYGKKQTNINYQNKDKKPVFKNKNF
jgi:hypothetical protein